MVDNVLSESETWKILDEIADPEIPVLSVVEMRIVRNVRVHENEVEIEITPTFVGCPALDTIAESIESKLLAKGFSRVRIRRNYTAGWSTDMLDDKARMKLEHFGIAPPSSTRDVVIEIQTPCPHCRSIDTLLENPFGATLCKQLYYCNACRQSFEKIKTL